MGAPGWASGRAHAPAVTLRSAAAAAASRAAAASAGVGRSPRGVSGDDTPRLGVPPRPLRVLFGVYVAAAW
jgi:hypothetical protein